VWGAGAGWWWVAPAREPAALGGGWAAGGAPETGGGSNPPPPVDPAVGVVAAPAAGIAAAAVGTGPVAPAAGVDARVERGVGVVAEQPGRERGVGVADDGGVKRPVRQRRLLQPGGLEGGNDVLRGREGLAPELGDPAPQEPLRVGLRHVDGQQPAGDQRRRAHPLEEGDHGLSLVRTRVDGGDLRKGTY